MVAETSLPSRRVPKVAPCESVEWSASDMHEPEPDCSRQMPGVPSRPVAIPPQKTVPPCLTVKLRRMRGTQSGDCS